MTRRAVLTLLGFSIVGAQAVTAHFLRREPYLPSPHALVNLPVQMGRWEQSRDESLPSDQLEMLGPDDYVARQYHASGRVVPAGLFVAYYKTQLRSKNAHDPKVCLPGAGWTPTDSHLSRIPTATKGEWFPVNYYRIRRNDREQVVLYWFQTPQGVYTGEQELSFHRLYESLVSNRTDVALVRITVPIAPGQLRDAETGAYELAQEVHGRMLSYFPPTEKSD